MKKRSNQNRKTAVPSHPSPGHVISPPTCSGCGLLSQQLAMATANQSLMNEQVVFLRNQVMKLQDQVLSFVPNAADQYTRMTLSQQANMSPRAMQGISSLKNLVPEDDVDMGVLDEVFNGIKNEFNVG